MTDTPTTCLRHRPLSHFLLRGRAAGTAEQYEELRNLQTQHAAITPVNAGPFRLLIFKNQDEMLRSAQKDCDSIIASLNQGIEVVNVIPNEDRTGGTVAGLIDNGRLFVVLDHQLPSPDDWQLQGVMSNSPQESPLAILRATWSINPQEKEALVLGDAAAIIRQFTEIIQKYQAWLNSWKSPVVQIPYLVFHIDRKIPRDATIDRLIKSLQSGAPLFSCRHRQPETFVNGQPERLLLYVKAYQTLLIAYPPRFEDVGPNEWLVTHVQKDPPDTLVPIVQLTAAQCHLFSQRIREQLPTIAAPQAWLSELAYWHQRYEQWRRHDWPLPTIAAGFFNLRVSQPKQVELEKLGISLDTLRVALNRGLYLFKPAGAGASDTVLAMPDGLQCQLQLRPLKSLMGPADWKLKQIRPAHRFMQPWAKIQAEWRTEKSTPLAGDAKGLISELLALENKRQVLLQQIQTTADRLAAEPARLAERINYWRRVCQLERDTLQVGVTRLEREGNNFVLVPERQDTVEEWLDSLESYNPEGVDWNRYPLELRVGDKQTRLVILSITVSQAENGQGEICLRVGCSNPLGRVLLEGLCNQEAVNANDETAEVRLFLPDTQLRLIEHALDTLHPQQQSPKERYGLSGDDLTPDDLSLRTLQRILADPNELEPLTPEWPPLPFRPLFELSANQEQAVRAAVFGPDMTLIQGPPGTGKTTVILEILHQLFRLHGKEAGFKVLLVAPTHVAVDNVLERLVAPKQGTNLVMQLGVMPYRVGATRRIPEHLRGFTPDCLNTAYCERLEQEVAQSIEQAERNYQRDQKVREILEDGAACDAVSWWHALRSHEFLGLGPWDLHPALEQLLPADINTPQGRVRLWRACQEQGSNWKARLELLQQWLTFLRNNPRFFSELLLSNANLVCATTVGCATHPELRSVVYDYVIVDEAGKEEARRLLVPLIRGERWILIGDHQQLPPYVDDTLQLRLKQEGLEPDILTRSLFEELQEPFTQRGRYVFLDQQGRMHPDISAFVSARFYGGRLRDFPQVSRHTMPRPAFLPDSPQLLVLDTRSLPDRHEKRRGPGYVNLLEQELALLILRAFVALPLFNNTSNDEKQLTHTIGVIAPYRRQVEEIEQRVRRDPSLKLLVSKGVLQVGTVDSFQGQERDLIIFTCTRSNPDGRLGFVDNRQRLNVALSRARRRLIIIADGTTIERAQLRTDTPSIEIETRDHLHALFAFARQRNGIVEVPEDWRNCWRP
ncbi:MAG: AAA domain-containing protein [Thermogemmata sp.]|nr:AAA domain-containing protein [Thermogemmata sp.]